MAPRIPALRRNRLRAGSGRYPGSRWKWRTAYAVGVWGLFVGGSPQSLADDLGGTPLSAFASREGGAERAVALFFLPGGSASDRARSRNARGQLLACHRPPAGARCLEFRLLVPAGRPAPDF